jgi:acyl carrier protein phosphodiesterase
MNFLSHFYFDQDQDNSNLIIGTILPDLVKNAHKAWNFYPQKNEAIFVGNQTQEAILFGWKRHLQVDLIFHSSSFFEEKTQQLKQLLLPILQNSPVRPSFLAHIGVELLLDYLLIEHHKIDINSFYKKLEKADPIELENFLVKCGMDNKALFFSFFNSFKSSRYLFSYQKIENISYALQRICMRLWEHPFNEKTVRELTLRLEIYKKKLEVDFMVIFEEIENRLT